MDEKGQSSFEMLLLLAVLLIIAIIVGFYLWSLAKAKPRLGTGIP